MSETKASILFVDDERPVLNALKRLFRPTGHKVHIAGSGSEGLALLAENPIDIVVSDMRMPEMDGAEFLTNVAEKWPSTTRMLLTGYAELSSAIEAINSGSISRYLTKPWQDADIVFCIEQAIETQQLVNEKNRLEKLTAEQNAELKTLNDGLETKVQERTRHLEQAKQELAAAHATLKDSFDATIEVFSRLVQSRSGLSIRASVAQDARAVGATLGLDEAACAAIYQAGLLCDIGKLSLPDKSVVFSLRRARRQLTERVPASSDCRGGDVAKPRCACAGCPHYSESLRTHGRDWFSRQTIRRTISRCRREYSP